jgi:uncharacterized protein
MQRHWLVTLQNLSSTGRSWDKDVPKALLLDKQFGSVNVLPGLLGDIHWQLSLSRQAKVFHLKGEWQACLKRECSRCNAAFDWAVTGQTERDLQFIAQHGSVDDDDDGQNCEYIAYPGELNLIDVLREDVWLAWNADVICSETCQGLCQGCGVNLNHGDCQCKQDDGDNPFAALRGLNLKG